MSFVEQDDIFNEIEPLMYDLFKTYTDLEVSPYPFKRITYAESLDKFGTDKPDLRNPLYINDITNCFEDSGFKIFEENIKRGHVIKSIKLPESSNQPRAWFDKMNDWARKNNQKGLGYIVFEDSEFKGPIAKNMKTEFRKKLWKLLILKTAILFFLYQIIKMKPTFLQVR